MKIKSALVTQVSGSVGGLTGSHNQGGMYFRARSVPINPSTAQQLSVRNALTVLTSAWNNTLTTAQRAAWETYNQNVPILDRLGEPRFIGAIAHYIRSNVPRIQAGFARVDDAPTVFNLGDFTEPSAAGNAGTPYDVDVTFTDSDAWANEDDAAMLVYLSREQNPGINFFKGPYQFAGSIDGNGTTPPTSPATITSPFNGATDNAVFGQVRVTRADGRLSGTFRFRDILA